MGSVGLPYVGAVLFVNGLMLLGAVPPRSAAILNLFVGALQCIVPTAMLIQADGDSAVTLAASGLYRSASRTCTSGSATSPGSILVASAGSRSSSPPQRVPTA